MRPFGASVRRRLSAAYAQTAALAADLTDLANVANVALMLRLIMSAAEGTFLLRFATVYGRVGAGADDERIVLVVVELQTADCLLRVDSPPLTSIAFVASRSATASILRRVAATSGFGPTKWRLVSAPLACR